MIHIPKRGAAVAPSAKLREWGGYDVITTDNMTVGSDLGKTSRSPTVIHRSRASRPPVRNLYVDVGRATMINIILYYDHDQSATYLSSS